jgi:hypothetical protein
MIGVDSDATTIRFARILASPRRKIRWSDEGRPRNFEFRIIKDIQQRVLTRIAEALDDVVFVGVSGDTSNGQLPRPEALP